MSVMEYAAKFNKLSRFAPNQVATKEMRIDHFEQGLKEEIKQIIVGYAYINFQEMYQRAAKVARIIDDTKIENKAKQRGKLALENPIPKEVETLEGLNLR